jgi:hypothetical protein
MDVIIVIFVMNSRLWLNLFLTGHPLADEIINQSPNL